MVLLTLFFCKRLDFIPRLLKILQSVNKRPQLCVIRYFFLNQSSFDCRKCVHDFPEMFQIGVKDSDFNDISFRGAVLTEREKNELNNQGIRILNTKAIGYSSQYIYEGESYDELRKVSELKVNHLILGD